MLFCDKKKNGLFFIETEFSTETHVKTFFLSVKLIIILEKVLVDIYIELYMQHHSFELNLF